LSGSAGVLGYDFKKGRNDWETPSWLFADLNQEFRFTTDAAASTENRLCSRFWTEADDGLAQSWAGENVFCNPPYGRQTGRWFEKAFWEVRNHACPLAVLLVPANTETAWWHDFVASGAQEIRFVRGRVHFLLGGRRVPNSRPVFSSAVLVFGGYRHDPNTPPGPIVRSIVAPDPRTLIDGRLPDV
jgi:phage N-6-adenine-methyltransferase